MKVDVRIVCTLCACFSLALPVISHAIDSPYDAIATPAYVNNMRTKTIMDKIDTNGDHAVSMEEGEIYFTKVFDALDRNKDGKLDRTEWVGATTEKDVVSLSTGGYARALGSMDMMSMADANKDHTVSKEEFLEVHIRMFKVMAGNNSTIDAQHFIDEHFPH